MSSDCRSGVFGRVALVCVVLWGIAVMPAAAVPNGIITYPANGGVYTSAGVTSISGTAAPTSGYMLTEVRAGLSRSVSGSSEYWNWTTQQWGAWDYAQCTKLATGTANWSVTSSLPAVWNLGSYGAYAYVFDTSSTTPYRTNSYFTISAPAPSVTITFPTNGGSYNVSALDHFSGTASSGGGTLDRVEVQLYYISSSNSYSYWQWDTRTWGAYDETKCWTRATGTSSWSLTTGLPPYWWTTGQYYVLGRAFNTNGVRSPYVAGSNFRAVSSDTTNPQVAVTYPVMNAWYYPGPTRLAGTASDASGVGIVQCYLAWSDRSFGVWRYWNWQARTWETTPSAGCLVTASGTNSWEVTGGFPTWMEHGYYGVAAVATDRVGRTQLSSWVYFNTGDTLAPTGAFTYPEAGAMYYPAPARIAGVASNGQSGVNHIDCTLAKNNSGVWTYWNWVTREWQTAHSNDCWKTATGKETWELTSGFPDPWPPADSYGVYARVFDNAGNIGFIPWLIYYVDDTVAPTVAITSPEAGGSYLPGTVQFTGTAFDAESGIDKVMCRLSYFDEDAGLWETWNWTTRIWEPYDMNRWTEFLAPAAGTEDWTLQSGLPTTWPCCADYYFSALAYDKYGNTNFDYVYFAIEDTAPPTVAITSPQSGGSYLPGAAQFAGTASDVGTGIDKVVGMIAYKDATGVWNYWNWTTHIWEPAPPERWSEFQGTADGTENWKLQSGLPATWPCCHQYYFVAIAYDKCENTNFAYVYFNIEDKTRPSVTITTPQSDGSYLPGKVQFTGTASDVGVGLDKVVGIIAYQDSLSVWNYWNGRAQAWEPLDASHWSDYYLTASGTESWTLESGLPDTWPCCHRYYLLAMAYDKCQNANYASVYFNIEDKSPPTVAITAPQSDVWYLPGAAEFAGTASDAGTGLDKVSCALAYYDDTAGIWKSWNWTKQIWQASSQIPRAETLTMADGTDSWTLQSGLPATWPCCKRYWFTATAYDKCANANSASVYFYLGDKVPPVISSVTASPDTLWPPNHQMVEVQVTVAATDNLDPAPVSRITAVTCNEPADAPGGNSPADWEITGDLTLRLRAERAGDSTSRVYTINVVCTDACGNSTTGSVDVTVPHDKGM